MQDASSAACTTPFPNKVTFPISGDGFGDANSSRYSPSAEGEIGGRHPGRDQAPLTPQSARSEASGGAGNKPGNSELRATRPRQTRAGSSAARPPAGYVRPRGDAPTSEVRLLMRRDVKRPLHHNRPGFRVLSENAFVTRHEVTVYEAA